MGFSIVKASIRTAAAAAGEEETERVNLANRSAYIARAKRKARLEVRLLLHSWDVDYCRPSMNGSVYVVYYVCQNLNRLSFEQFHDYDPMRHTPHPCAVTNLIIVAY